METVGVADFKSGKSSHSIKEGRKKRRVYTSNAFGGGDVWFTEEMMICSSSVAPADNHIAHKIKTTYLYFLYAPI